MRVILPIMMLALFAGLIAMARNEAEATAPNASVVQAAQAGQAFMDYAGAVASFQQANPAFTGTVSPNQLATMGHQFSSQFLANSGNAITAAGASGRVVTAHAALPPGAISTITDSIEGAAANYGIASGANWTSVAQGATPQPLATAVPDGRVVFVSQVGQ